MKTGSVIHSTLRLQDLIPAFLKTLYEVGGQPALESFLQDYGTLPPRRSGAWKLVVEGKEWIRDDHPWWRSEGATYWLEALFDRLEDLAPEGYTFGAHPGDGSDFGFWPVEAED